MSVPNSIIPKGYFVKFGLRSMDNIHYQSPPDQLIQDTLQRGEGRLSDTGALVIKTGELTSYTPNDTFTVKDEITANTVDWNEFNIPIEEKYFHIIFGKIMDYLNQQPHIWIRDYYACADPRYRMTIRITTEKPWISLFAYNMFLRPTEKELENFAPEWTVIAAPELKLDPVECGTRQSNATIVSFKHKTILIAGSDYTGEIKKGIFGVLNYLLPQQKNVLSMHCSANIGKQGDTAVFFGLSGTGKTTLSTVPDRKLIGDDEHGWSEDTLFNFEGGCYVKCMNLTEENEPQIFRAIRWGALVENVTFYPSTNRINFEDVSITENTRVSYPLNFISNSVEPPIGTIPNHVFFLTCDAFGVLPPIAKLSPAQAMYHFISGYTAKIAGTEEGTTEPKPTFSACFGAPFLPLHPGKYAEMLGKKLKEHNVHAWLVNTGWTGGPYSIGTRIKLKQTRAMIAVALAGQLDQIETVPDPTFRVAIPVSCPAVPAELLNPRNTWIDKEAYDQQANRLAGLFIKNFEKYQSGISSEIQESAPKGKL